MIKFAKIALPCILLCVLLSGCATNGQESQSNNQNTNNNQFGHLTEKLQNLFPHFSADYTVADSPGALEELSKIVILGDVSEYAEGRAWHFRNVDDGVYKSTFVKVKVKKIYKFPDSDFPPTDLWVEVNQNLSREPFDYSALLPAGSEFLLYLEPAQETSGPNIIFSDSSYNWKNRIGGILYRFVSPQGWAVSVPLDNTVVWPLAQEVSTGTLRDFEPKQQ